VRKALTLLAFSLIVGACGPASEELGGASAHDDPGLIVFTGSTGDRELIHVIRPDGTGLRPLRLGEPCRLPDEFSPDGRLAVCSSYDLRDDEQRLNVIGLNGSEVRRVPLPAGENSWFSLSPDGTQFVFLNSPDISSDVEELWKARIDGQDAKRLVADGGAADWSPDGKRIAFTGGNFAMDCGGDLVVMDADGGGRHEIAQEASGLPPHWSPDGQRIAFLRGDCDTSDLWTVQVDGGSPTLVARDVFDSFAWSLDSKRIAFMREGAPLGWGSSVRFLITSATGGKPRPIGPTASDAPAQVFWVPSSAILGNPAGPDSSADTG
jgi:Tol biopolymer transport system component